VVGTAKDSSPILNLDTSVYHIFSEINGLGQKQVKTGRNSLLRFSPPFQPIIRIRTLRQRKEAKQ